MTRAPLLRLGGADGGSCLTVLGVDAEDRDADLASPRGWTSISGSFYSARKTMRGEDDDARKTRR
jgi:hypothetical protein